MVDNIINVFPRYLRLTGSSDPERTYATAIAYSQNAVRVYTHNRFPDSSDIPSGADEVWVDTTGKHAYKWGSEDASWKDLGEYERLFSSYSGNGWTLRDFDSDRLKIRFKGQPYELYKKHYYGEIRGFSIAPCKIITAESRLYLPNPGSTYAVGISVNNVSDCFIYLWNPINEDWYGLPYDPDVTPPPKLVANTDHSKILIPEESTLERLRHFCVAYDGTWPLASNQTYEGYIMAFWDFNAINELPGPEKTMYDCILRLFESKYEAYQYSNKNTPSDNQGRLNTDDWTLQVFSKTYTDTEGIAVLEERTPIWRDGSGLNQGRFWYNGLGVLQNVNSCIVKETINGEFVATIETIQNVNNLLEENMLLSIKPSPDQGRQLFRIVSIKNDMRGKQTITAYHISYDMNGYFIGKIPTYNLDESALDWYNPDELYPAGSYVRNRDLVYGIEDGAYYCENAKISPSNTFLQFKSNDDPNTDYYPDYVHDKTYYWGDCISRVLPGATQRKNYIYREMEGANGEQIEAANWTDYFLEIPNKRLTSRTVKKPKTRFGLSGVINYDMDALVESALGDWLVCRMRDIIVCVNKDAEAVIKHPQPRSAFLGVGQKEIGKTQITAVVSVDGGNTFKVRSIFPAGTVRCYALFTYNNAFYAICLYNFGTTTLGATSNLFGSYEPDTIGIIKSTDGENWTECFKWFHLDQGVYWPVVSDLLSASTSKYIHYSGSSYSYYDATVSNVSINSNGAHIVMAFSHTGSNNTHDLEAEYGLASHIFYFGIPSDGSTPYLNRVVINTNDEEHDAHKIKTLTKYRFTNIFINAIDSPKAEFPYGVVNILFTAKVRGEDINLQEIYETYFDARKITSPECSIFRVDTFDPDSVGHATISSRTPPHGLTFTKSDAISSEMQRTCAIFYSYSRNAISGVLYRWKDKTSWNYHNNVEYISETDTFLNLGEDNYIKQVIMIQPDDPILPAYIPALIGSDLTTSAYLYNPDPDSMFTDENWPTIFNNIMLIKQMWRPTETNREYRGGIYNDWSHMSLNAWKKVDPPLTKLSQAVQVRGTSTQIEFMNDYTTPYVCTSDGLDPDHWSNLLFTISYDAGSTPDDNPSCTPGAFKLDYPENLRAVLMQKIIAIFRRKNDSAPVFRDGTVDVDAQPKRPFELKFDNNRIIILGAGRGKDTDQILYYGKNIEEFTIERSHNTCYTAIYPYYYTDEEGLTDLTTLGCNYNVVVPEKIRNVKGYNPASNGVYILDLTTLTNDAGEQLFESAPGTEAEILDAVSRFDADNGILEPTVAFTIKMSQLNTSVNAAAYEYLNFVTLGDKMWVNMPQYNYKEEIRVVGVEYDVLTGLFKTITFGKASDRIENVLAGIEQDVKNGNKRAATQYTTTKFVSKKVDQSLSSEAVSNATVKGLVQAMAIDGSGGTSLIGENSITCTITQVIQHVLGT